MKNVARMDGIVARNTPAVADATDQGSRNWRVVTGGMTKFQRKLAEAVEANGYVVVNVYEVPSAPRTARSMWERFGYHYSYCGPHIAISKTKEGATMAREFAKNRHRIAKFDNASGTPSHIEWYRAQMLKGSL